MTTYTIRGFDIWTDKELILSEEPKVGDTIRFIGWGETTVVFIYKSLYEPGEKFVRVSFGGHILCYRMKIYQSHRNRV